MEQRAQWLVMFRHDHAVHLDIHSKNTRANLDAVLCIHFRAILAQVAVKSFDNQVGKRSGMGPFKKEGSRYSSSF